MRKSLATRLALVLAAATLALPGLARADLPPIAGSVHGGDVEMTSRGALSVGMGWPSLYARYDFGTSGRFGIGIRSDIFYGHIGYGWGLGFGWGVDLPMRIQVVDRQSWALAITLDPGFFLGFDDRWYYDYWWDDRDEDVFVFGPRFGAGVVASLQPVPFLNVFFGLRTGVDIMLIDPEHHELWVDVVVPIRTFGGVELSVHRSIAIFADLSLGPAVVSQRWCRRWDRGECRDWETDVDARFTGLFYTGAIFYFGR